jgi:hypothetical protein
VNKRPVDRTQGRDRGGLRRSVTGAVVVPTDAGYDAASRYYNALIDRRRAVIVSCLGGGDVPTALDFARQGLEVAVRRGRHTAAGHRVSDGASLAQRS